MYNVRSGFYKLKKLKGQGYGAERAERAKKAVRKERKRREKAEKASKRRKRLARCETRLRVDVRIRCKEGM